MRFPLPINKRSVFSLLALTAPVLVVSPPTRADQPPAPVVGFIKDHCTTCHNADQKGRLDLITLTFAPNDSANLSIWAKIHDRVNAGEMPRRSRRSVSRARRL